MAKKWYVWEDKAGIHIDDEPCKNSPVREAVITEHAPKWAQAAFDAHQEMVRENARIKLRNAQSIIEQKSGRTIDEVTLYARIEKNICGFDARARVTEMSKRFSGDYIFNSIFASRVVVNNA